MAKFTRPSKRPSNPCFSSGPCSKPPGWHLGHLSAAALGRSHRAKGPKSKIAQAIENTREVLGVPDEFRIGVVPASDTGAVELALWSLLGQRPTEVLAWDAFGKDWAKDIVSQLKIPARIHSAEFGELPDLKQVDFERDVVFTWNGTTSGVRVPDGDFIPLDRDGLTICDATSAAFAVRLPWDKLDVTTFSWQKVMGGEAAHGMLILSPRAVERLETYVPAWPLPKIFRITKAGSLNEAIFKGATINTPSMLCVEDYLVALEWARSVGGLDALIARADSNARAVSSFVEGQEWIDFLAKYPKTRSNTSVCLKFSDDRIPVERAASFAKEVAAKLELEGVAYDIGSYRDAPPGLRIWCGATVERDDVDALMPWIGWAYEECASEMFAIA